MLISNLGEKKFVDGLGKQAKSVEKTNEVNSSAKVKDSSPASKLTDSARVNVSNEFSTLVDMVMNMADPAGSEVDEVARVKEQIARGEYQPDWDKVVDGMFEDADMLSSLLKD
jgi:anti-sigma28 factor (negative regulator of flagellin synthesis)